jgi:glutamate-1-semialdehyde 2,1-aminomutase
VFLWSSRYRRPLPVSLSANEEAYQRRTPGTERLMTRAARSLPGGNTRTHGHHLPYPLAFSRGAGPHLWDVDGSRYIDFEYNGTSLIHGHAFPPITEAIAKTAAAGTAWTGSSPQQVEFAELLCERVESFERVRFCNSGTEAGMLAAKLARRATGRPLLLKSWFGYHGFYDDLEAGLHGKGEVRDRTLLAPFGDAAAFERILEDHGDDIAAIVLEPVLVTGMIVPPPDFFPRLRKAASDVGALLILDECVMFRLAEGGAQQKLGIIPDLTILSKFVGGGLPVGVLGGPSAILDHFDPRREDSLYHGGTFNGNVLVSAAGTVTLRELTGERIAVMDRHTERLDHALRDMAKAIGLPLSVTREGSILALYFRERVPDLSAGDTWEGGVLDKTDARQLREFQLACLNHGIFITPAREMVLSTAIDDAVLDEAIGLLRDVLEDVARTAA